MSEIFKYDMLMCITDHHENFYIRTFITQSNIETEIHSKYFSLLTHDTEPRNQTEFSESYHHYHREHVLFNFGNPVHITSALRSIPESRQKVITKF